MVDSMKEASLTTSFADDLETPVTATPLQHFTK
jgi:hypothetical protein